MSGMLSFAHMLPVLSFCTKIQLLAYDNIMQMWSYDDIQSAPRRRSAWMGQPRPGADPVWAYLEARSVSGVRGILGPL